MAQDCVISSISLIGREKCTQTAHNVSADYAIAETTLGFYLEDRLSNSAGKFLSLVCICHSSVKMANRSSAEMDLNWSVFSSAWMSL
jgi:hypothetical protein